MRLKNQVAVVTGGARGLGAEMCRLFAKEGAKVIAVDMGEMTYQAEGVEFYRLNITDPTACRAFYEETMSKYEHISMRTFLNPQNRQTPCDHPHCEGARQRAFAPRPA